MIVKNFTVHNFFEKEKFFLFYGENEGLKEEISNKLKEQFTKETIFTYHEKDILNDLDTFFSNIYTQSFFDNKKLILVKDITDKFLDQIEIIIKKRVIDVTIVLIAAALDKKSKLRNFFEKNNGLICVPFYKDDKNTLSNIAHSFFKSKKINISQASINLIVDRSSEDRKNLKNELIKIESFLAGRKSFKDDDLLKITNLAENYSMIRIVDLSLAKEKKQLFKILNENIFNQEDNIILIRSYINRSKRLIRLSDQYNKSRDLDQTISSYKPPIFWKEKDIVKKQLRVWSKDSLLNLIKELNKVELLIKKNVSSSKELLFDFLTNKCLD